MNARLLANAIALSVLLATSNALLRHASRLGDPLSMPRALYTVVALSLYFGLFLYYSLLLERLSLSKLYPVYTGLSVVLVSLLGVAVFGDGWSLRTVVGVALIALGVMLVSGGGGQ